MAAIASMNSLQGTLAPGKPIAIVRSTRPHSNSIHGKECAYCAGRTNVKKTLDSFTWLSVYFIRNPGFSRIAVTGRKNFKIQAVLTAESTLDVTKVCL